jgi:hypothetical protein
MNYKSTNGISVEFQSARTQRMEDTFLACFAHSFIDKCALDVGWNLQANV